MTDHYSRRTTFDEQADYYDETSGTYPAQFIDDIIHFSGIADDGRILEIGCGTGQATQSFAERGYAITAIELGPNLATLASRKLAKFPKVDIINMAFEDWPLEAQAFDLVISMDAFHWIPPEIGYPKVVDALKPGGTAAFSWYVDRRTDMNLSQQIQHIYEEIAPQVDNPLSGKTSTSDFMHHVFHRDIRHAPGFSTPVVRKYPRPEHISAAQKIKQLYTYSLHRDIDMEIRKRLYNRIEQAINHAGGQLTIEQEVMLFLVKKQ